MSAHPRSPLAPDRFPDLPPIAGLSAATARLGLYPGAREDLLIVAAPQGSVVAGAFTTSATRSADIDWCRTALETSGGRGRAIVCNAGNSNAFTGPAGVAKDTATAAAAARLLGCPEHEIYLAATGVIGQPLAPNRVADALPDLAARLGPPDWERLARAFMTTDTFPKGAGAAGEIGGVAGAVAGIAKGSGMIAPNMATMLVFVFTDFPLTPAAAQKALSAELARSFNAITVDGDTSTSDTLLLFATGAAGGPAIEADGDPRLAQFQAMLGAVMQDLALQVVRDGEGARKLIEITVEGALHAEDARRVAMAIANSPLVKTAIAGEDANWGRVVMAVGKSGATVDRDRLGVRFGPEWTARNGGACPYDAAAVDAHIRGDHVTIGVELGLGPASTRVWTCDLTDGYIRINGAYRT